MKFIDYPIKTYCLPIICGFLFIACSETQTLPQLQEKVEVVRDKNGINHIFAQNEQDLFFAQGYLAAKDRLFQFELWRRQATGTLAEILGPDELARDIGARLFQFRGEKKTELNHYHENGEAIVDAFVDGVNAYIDEVRADPDLLPLEFQMLGILPEHWTWEVVISRHQGLLQNVTQELNYTRIVSLIGTEETKRLFNFHPFEPNLDIDASIPEELIFKDIIAPYNAFRSPVVFAPEHVKEEFRNQQEAFLNLKDLRLSELKDAEKLDPFSIGSNNWVLSGELTESGYPLMANDPHRLQAIPSLRYWVHLHAPGWNVVGGGEPVIPGVSIGHNDFGAWGLTIFRTDNEDLRIYDIHPENPHQYSYRGEWLEMTEIADTIPVKGRGPEIVRHYYTIHGPVTFIDEELQKAVAIQCAWLEPGGAPYLASLRMGQAKNWEEFREACRYNHVPAENMVWADRDGNIGWQATGIAPVRNGFSGLVALNGDGSQDWDGFLPMLERPHAYNPESGFLATANENLVDATYTYPQTIGYNWSDAFRGDRIREVLEGGQKFTMEEMGRLQNDYLSLPARELVPYLENLNFSGEKARKAQEMLLDWDFVLDKNSVRAGIYVMWERKIRSNMAPLVVPNKVRSMVGALDMTKVLEWVKNGDKAVFGENGVDAFLADCMEDALRELEKKLGADMENWRYGQENYKHAVISHPLSPALSAEWREKLNVGPVPRGGYSFTPGANAYGDNNTTGASFKIIVDTGDWEKTMGINNPGQSGDPESKFYKNLMDIWAEDDYFQVAFDPEKIRKEGVEKVVLR